MSLATTDERPRAAGESGAARRPRIVFVMPTFLPESFGGAEQQTRKMARTLARRGCRVTILAPKLQPATRTSEEEDGVAIRRFPLGAAPNLGGRHLPSFLSWCLKVSGWLWRNRESYDVIQVIHARLHAVPAALLGPRLGKPVLIKLGRGGEEFDLDVVARKRLLGGRLARVIEAGTTAWVANSREIADDLARWGIAEARIHRIPNGVEMAAPVARAPDPDGMPRCVYLGRLDRGKAIDVMLRGVALLDEAFRPRLDIVGDGPARAELEALARELGLEGAVTFTGAVRDVGPALRAADIYVSTSLSEGMSNALLEAMSFGCMPLVSKVSGVADIVEDGRSGLLFEPGDPRAFAAALEWAMALPPEARRAMGDAARATVSERFGMEAVADQFLSAYRERVGA